MDRFLAGAQESRFSEQDHFQKDRKMFFAFFGMGLACSVVGRLFRVAGVWAVGAC